MKTLPALLAGLILMAVPLAAAAGNSFEARCEADMKPHFVVRTFQADIRIDNTVASRVLNTRSIHAHSSQRMLGLTALQSRVEVAIDGPSLRDPGADRECVAPIIEVDLHYKPMDVFIAREFSPVSCPYRAVLEHEMQHVKIYRDNLPRIKELLEGALATRFGNAPLYARAGMGLDALTDHVDRWLRPLIQAELASVEAAQARLDTAEETSRLSAACWGDLAYRLGASL